MVRIYKRKTERGNYGSKLLNKALPAVKDGVPVICVSKDGVPVIRASKDSVPVIRASKECGVLAHTLRRQRDSAVFKPGVVQLGHKQPVVSKATETVMGKRVQFMEKRKCYMV